jgi:hypothetical protein
MLDAESSMLARCCGSMQLDAGSMLCLDGGSMAQCLLDASMGEDILR